MSASASKKKRKELEGQGISAKDIAVMSAKEKRKKTIKSVLMVVLAMVVCAAAVFAVIKLVNRPRYDTSAAVITVGNEKISVPIYNYLYNYNATNFYNNYSYLVKTGTPFAEQNNVFGEGTLEDYFKQSTNDSVKEILNVVGKAKAAGYTLSDEEKATVANAVSAAKADAQAYGYPSVDKYLQVRFGEGCDIENYEEFQTLIMMYSGYVQKLSDEYAPSAADLQARYEQDPSVYDLVSFTSATASAESTEVEPTGVSVATQSTDPSESTEPTQTPTTTYTDESKAEARAKAEGYTKEMPEDAITRTYTKSNITSFYNAEIADWLFDPERKEGDTKVFASNEAEIYFYAIRFDGRDTNDYCLANANVLTITKDKKEESKEDEDKQEAQNTEKTAEQKRDELLAAIHDGMTDEEFSKAVSALGYSVSTNSITKTYSIEEIRDFLYDDSRKAGDLFTEYENDTSYYIVRFASREEKTYRDQMVESTLWSEYFTDIASANELNVSDEMMKFANTNLIFNANSSQSN